MKCLMAFQHLNSLSFKLLYQCFQCLKQQFRVYRLAQMSVEAGLHAAFHIFIKSICRKCDHRYRFRVFPARRTDGFFLMYEWLALLLHEALAAIDDVDTLGQAAEGLQCGLATDHNAIEGIDRAAAVGLELVDARDDA